MASMNKETYITVQTPKIENVTSNKKYIANCTETLQIIQKKNERKQKMPI